MTRTSGTPRIRTQDYSPSSRTARIRKRELKRRRANLLLVSQVLVLILPFAVLGLLILEAYGPTIDKSNHKNFWFTLSYSLIFVVGTSVIVFSIIWCLGLFNEEEEEENQEQED